MKKETYKKFVTFGIVLAFLGLAIIPTINAVNIDKENINKNFNKILLKSSKQTKSVGTNSICDLLIITADEFARLLQPLKKHKDEYGVKTQIVNLSDIYNEILYGYDKPEKIKYFIKSAIEEWGIKYVLLVGGKKGPTPYWHLPVRYVKMDEGWEPHYLSDLYFADIYDSEGKFSSWDSDNDGHYSKWYYKHEAEDKNVDLYPDVAVGRIPCRNERELKIMVNKIIDYETTTYDRIWFKDMIVIAGDTYPEIHNPNWTGYEGEYYAELALENMTGFNKIAKRRKHYINKDLLPSNIKDELDQGKIVSITVTELNAAKVQKSL